jgi:hypothetical protein
MSPTSQLTTIDMTEKDKSPLFNLRTDNTTSSALLQWAVLDNIEMIYMQREADSLEGYRFLEIGTEEKDSGRVFVLRTERWEFNNREDIVQVLGDFLGRVGEGPTPEIDSPETPKTKTDNKQMSASDLIEWLKEERAKLSGSTAWLRDQEKYSSTMHITNAINRTLAYIDINF